MKLNLTKKEVNEISTDDDKWETVKQAFERRGGGFESHFIEEKTPEICHTKVVKAFLKITYLLL